MSDSLGLIELVIFAAVALGWGFRELWLLRDRKDGKPPEGDGRGD